MGVGIELDTENSCRKYQVRKPVAPPKTSLSAVAWGRKRVQTCTHAHELLQNDVLFDTVGASFKAYMYPRLFLPVIYQPMFSITPMPTFFYGFSHPENSSSGFNFRICVNGQSDYGRPASELHDQPQGQSTNH